MSCFCIRPNKSNTQNVTTTIASTASNPENTITTVATASTLPHSFLSKILGKGKLESKVNKKKEDSASTYTEPVKLNIRNEAIQKFCFDELSAATDNFKNIVGQGGFGGVYLGMLQTKQVVAIKRRDSNGVQGTQQFIAEVETLSNVSHKNIVQLIGYCYEKEHKLLVYEYMGLGSLEDNLSDHHRRGILHWDTRMRIATEIAKGVEYLHVKMDPPMIYRDLKS
ncbi:probable serine/threonine-protein kinase PBL6 [Medicago truncatula]|nr:probable serine/threonine-protein kinase PBL6 [Medicago truncatula]